MNENCPKCNFAIKTVPAGISKRTGKPYQAFQACSNRDCNWKPLQKPQAIPQRPQTTGPSQHEQVMKGLRDTYALCQNIEHQLFAIHERLEELQSTKANLNPDNINF